jgi:acetylornithine/N-succinyldiaminopimelate aminotransferase
MTDVFMKTYHRLPVTFSRGEGAWLFDASGNRYLDFTSGIAVNCLGHNYPPLVKAISEQAAKLNHVSNYFQSDVTAAFAERLVEACAGVGMKKVFLANSGAEANEGAIKIARKYSLKKHGTDRHTILTIKGSFHGRTITTLAATGQDKFHQDFGPFTPGFKYVPFGDIKALEWAMDSLIAGVLIEPVVGEGGIFPQEAEYLRTLVKFCAERDILLIADEVQCGVGRTGTFLASEAYGIKPDIVTLAKGLAGGVPCGAVLAGEKAADVFSVGDHGSTFGGNPLAAAAGLAVLQTVTDAAFLRDIVRKGEKMQDIIRSWNSPEIKAIRGKGLMIGIDIDREAWPVLEACIARADQGTPGLLLLSAGAKTLRFLPPYIIADAEIEQGLEMLRGVLA